VTAPLAMRDGKVSEAIHSLFSFLLENRRELERNVQCDEARVAKESNTAVRILPENILRITRMVQ
jgi:hypothetical protein